MEHNLEQFLTLAFWFDQIAFLIRMLLACLCGAAIGFERKNRLKEAGIRTHLIVSLAAALMMIVSKYGFFDLLVNESIKLDPSRVAAGIVTGIGFLGGGMISIRKQVVSGLTTAAGVWATMGVGMAIGAGMYVLGIVSTLMIIVSQLILHSKTYWKKNIIAEPITVQMENSAEAIAYLHEKIKEAGTPVLGMKADKIDGNLLEVEISVKLPAGYDMLSLIKLFQDNHYVKSVEL